MTQFIEPFCGTAAMSYYLCCDKAKPPLSYQGGKATLAAALAHAMDEALGGRPAYTGVVLYDANTLWPRTHRALYQDRALLCIVLEQLAAGDPREVFDELLASRGPPSCVDGVAAAEFLFLQRVAFGGKAVYHDGDRWRTPGFNKSSAYGCAASGTHGAVKPQVPAMIERIRTLPVLVQATERRGRAVEYLDPPYRGTTGYGYDLSRAELVARALTGAEAGHAVFVSEAEPLVELVASGWKATCVREATTTNKPQHCRKAEWLTWWVPPDWS